MRNTGVKNRMSDWVRVAAKLSLLFTDPKVRATVADTVKKRGDEVSDTIAGKYSDVSDAVADKYEDAVDRLEHAVRALRGRNHWASRVTGLLLGVGVGAGLGILLAPAAGWETRRAVREKAVDAKNKVFDSASSAAGKIRQTIANMPSTGTEG
ncbi:MAG TPA: YtxH domain-containing protein [Terriglobales bacterium]|nr:YtxH domain-containing protein [Terriglobales bacterium]